MRVVVTGATGNVGTSVVETLAADPQITSIVGLARRGLDPIGTGGGPEDLDLRTPTVKEQTWSPDRTEIRAVDVSRDRLDEVFAGADAVVHLAWLFHPIRNGVATWKNNVLGARRVFEAAGRAGVRTLVYSSSVGAYSAGVGDTRVDESWPTHSLPTAAYGREKAYVERLLDIFERDHPEVRVVRLRPAFIFKHEASVGQRRIFAGPWLPQSLIRRELVPLLPHVEGLRFQALHASDVAEAFRLAVVDDDARGAYNVAADPVVDLRTIARLLHARTFPVPAGLARQAAAALFHLRVVPASPQLVDLVLSLPLMDTTRIRSELGWSPVHDSVDALGALLTGMHDGDGFATPPLAPATSGPLRLREIATGIGARADT